MWDVVRNIRLVSFKPPLIVTRVVSGAFERPIVRGVRGALGRFFVENEMVWQALYRPMTPSDTTTSFGSSKVTAEPTTGVDVLCPTCVRSFAEVAVRAFAIFVIDASKVTP